MFIAASLRVIDSEKALSLNLKPGQKLCRNCFLEPAHQSETEISDTDYQPPVDRNAMESTLAELSCSPFDIAKLSNRDKVPYAKRKYRQINSAAKEKVARMLSLSAETLSSNEEAPCEGCKDLDTLVTLLKEKCSTSTKQEQISLLTLAPASWTIAKCVEQFNVSSHIVKRARKLKGSQGILSKPVPKKGKELMAATKEEVVKFYECDDNSRICPGKKDFVSVKVDGQRQQVQKRLLLVNLRELYVSFTTSNGNKRGFSKFCELRPKSCVTVSASGMHSVCVCEIHQNVKLLLAAVPGKVEYKHLIAQMVCNVDDRNCMLHECERCPGTQSVTEFLTQQFTEEDMDDDDIVSYKQWLHTDRTTIVSLQLPVSEFIETLVKALDALRHHHYIAKSQSTYLKSTKDSLHPGSIVILMDFAENYSFVVQDAVQGQHWNNSQVTLHPFAIYYKQGDELKCLSVCVVSDYLQHSTNAVHAYISTVITHLKSRFHVKHIFYFTDGAASQYKNYKNLSNLCHHMRDFEVEAEWHFFATSHGKSPCDGIGGTVKRLVARASLQATSSNQILTPQELYTWASKNISGISFFFVSAEDIKQHEVRFCLEERYSKIKTIPGTRSHHAFLPTPEGSLQMKRVSADAIYTIVRVGIETVDAESRAVDDEAYQPGLYIACVYDSDWHIGNIVERLEANQDLLINFMQRKGNKGLAWPLREDKCWVPFMHVLCTVSVPQVEGASARQYRISDNDYDHIVHTFNHFKQ